MGAMVRFSGKSSPLKTTVVDIEEGRRGGRGGRLVRHLSGLNRRKSNGTLILLPRSSFMSGGEIVEATEESKDSTSANYRDDSMASLAVRRRGRRKWATTAVDSGTAALLIPFNRKRTFNPLRTISDFSRLRSSRRVCQWHHQLNAEKEALVQRKRQRLMAQLDNANATPTTPNRDGALLPIRMRAKKPDFNRSNAVMQRMSTTSSGPSRARIGISHLSVPLAWNSDEHFGSRGEGRMYSMFVVLQTKGNVIDSRIVAAIDRTCTDVNFPDCFIFENQSVDFEVEVSLYSARTDAHGDINQTLKQKLTRSLGRKLGAAYKSSLPNEDAIYDPSVMCVDTTSNSNFRLLGRTVLTLDDARPKTGIYDLRLSTMAEGCGPPLYGHICCRMVAQPNSVVMPLSDGTLTIKPLDEDRVYQNVRCRLQGGVLRCSVPLTQTSRIPSEQSLLHIYFTKDSKVLSSRFPKSLILTSDRYSSGCKRAKEYLVTADNEEDIAAWRHAFSLQICDCEKWGEFAVSSVKLTCESPKPEAATVSRTRGKSLYDEIQVTGTLTSYSVNGTFDACSPHKNLPEPSTVVSFPSPAKANQTAPSGRRRNRAPVQTLFEQEHQNDATSRYIINLQVGDVENSEAPANGHLTNGHLANGHCNENGYANVDCIRRNSPRRTDYQHSESSESQGSGRFKGLRKSWQRSFGALLNRKPHTEVSRF